MGKVIQLRQWYQLWACTFKTRAKGSSRPITEKRQRVYNTLRLGAVAFPDRNLIHRGNRDVAGIREKGGRERSTPVEERKESTTR